MILTVETQRLAAVCFLEKTPDIHLKMKDPLQELTKHDYSGNKKPLLDAMVQTLTGPKKFNGFLAKEDLLYIMKGAFESQGKNASHAKKRTQECIHDMY